MRIKKILTIVAIAICNVVYAQYVTQQSFNDAVDFANCKYVELSLRQSRTSGVISQFQSKCKCDGFPVPDSITIITEIPSTEKRTTEFSSQFDGVKKEFTPDLLELDVANLLTNKVFSDETKYPKLFTFDTTRKKDTAFLHLKTEIKTYLPNIIVIHQTDEPSQTRPEKPPNGKSWFGGITFQIDIFSITIAVLITLLLLNFVYGGRSSPELEVSNRIKGYVEDMIHKAHSRSSNTGMSSLEINKLNEEILKLKSEIRHLNIKIDGAKVPMEVILPKYQEDTWHEVKQPEVKQENFFLSTPNSDGSFNESSALSTYKEGASIYRFTKTGNNRAVFQIDERDTSIKLALQYPDKNIDPVCEAMNAFNPKAKRISTKEQGEAELQDGKWVKTTKAKITYES